MDGVALASVITSGVLGIATASIAIWTARQSAMLARETRLQQRLADAYVKVLELIEQEAQWAHREIQNFNDAALGDQRPLRDPRDDNLEGPPLSNQATIRALLAAFGSSEVRKLYETWATVISEIEIEKLRIKTGWLQLDDPDALVDQNELKILLEVLRPREPIARQALANAIAAELGHRRV